MNTLQKLHHLDRYLPKDLLRLGEAKYLSGKTLKDLAPILEKKEANRRPSTFLSLLFFFVSSAIACLAVTYFSRNWRFGIVSGVIIGFLVYFVLERRFDRYNKTRFIIEEAEAQVVRLYDALIPFDLPKDSLERELLTYARAVVLRRTELQAMRANLHYGLDMLATKCEEWRKAEKELEEYRQKLTEWELISQLDQDQILQDAESQVKFEMGQAQSGRKQEMQSVV